MIKLVFVSKSFRMIKEMPITADNMLNRIVEEMNSMGYQLFDILYA